MQITLKGIWVFILGLFEELYEGWIFSTTLPLKFSLNSSVPKNNYFLSQFQWYRDKLFIPDRSHVNSFFSYWNEDKFLFFGFSKLGGNFIFIIKKFYPQIQLLPVVSREAKHLSGFRMVYPGRSLMRGSSAYVKWSQRLHSQTFSVDLVQVPGLSGQGRH